MSELVTEIPVSGGSSSQDGDHHYGEDPSVPAGNVATLVSFAAPGNWRFCGFIGWGETDAIFWVEYDGSQVYPKRRISITEKNAALYVFAPDPASGGTTVELKVQNLGDATAAFEGELLGA